MRAYIKHIFLKYYIKIFLKHLHKNKTRYNK